MTTSDLHRDGFCVVRGAIDGELIASLRSATDALIDATTPEQREQFGRQGINVQVNWQSDAFVDLVVSPGILGSLAKLGFDGPRFWSGFILCKEPRTPSLYWHQDWLYWDQPISKETDPAMVFAMVYLTATSRANGCLRVVPGSHLKRHPLHDTLPDAHTDATYHAPSDSQLFTTAPDEVDVPVEAGDLVIGDARVLHAAHANESDARRTCITLWYFPRYDEFDDRLQASVQQLLFLPYTGSDPRMSSLLPDYTGDAQPIAHTRTPTF